MHGQTSEPETESEKKKDKTVRSRENMQIWHNVYRTNVSNLICLNHPEAYENFAALHTHSL